MGLFDKLLETGLKAVDTVGTMKDGVKRDLAIKELERKKKTSQSMVQNEIDEIQNEIHNRYAELGMLIYELCLSGRIANSKLNKAIDVEFITNLKKAIDDKNAEILEIGYRYDSEISDISGSPQGGVAQYTETRPPSHHPTVDENAHGGRSLQYNEQPVQAIQHVQADESVENKPLMCGECQEPYTVGESMFCDSCGSRL